MMYQENACEGLWSLKMERKSGEAPGGFLQALLLLLTGCSPDECSDHNDNDDDC